MTRGYISGVTILGEPFSFEGRVRSNAEWMRVKAGVIGVGKLGGTVAFAIADQGLFDELVLCDVVESLAWAQAEDIRHGIGDLQKTVVRPGRVPDLKDADVVVIAAGQGRKPGMSRLDLLRTNAPVVAAVCRDVARIAPKAVLVLLTNPLDVMTAVAWKTSGLPRDQIVGSAAYLDSVRFRTILAGRYGARVPEVEAAVLGEHGDRAVPVFSRVRVRGKPLALTPQERKEIRDELTQLAALVIGGKGGTAFGPAGCTAALVGALFSDDPTTLPASVVLDGQYGLRDVAVGVPAILGRGRVLGVEEWALSQEEKAAFDHAGRDLAGFVSEAMAGLGAATSDAKAH